MQESTRNHIQPAAISFSGLLLIFFEGILKGVRTFIRFVFRNKWLLLLCVLVGGALGYARYVSTDPVFRVSMIVKSTELTGNTVGQMVRNLNQLSISHSFSGLAKELEVPEAIASTISGFEASNIQKQDLIKDTAQALNRNYIIDIFLTDNKQTSLVQTGLLNYFNHNDYLSRKKNAKIRLTEEKVVFLTGELKKLDSLKIEYNKFLNSGKNAGMFYNNAFNPVNLYEKSAEFQEELAEAQEWLAMSRQSIVIIDGIKPTIVPQSMSIFQYITLFALISFTLGCVIIALVRNLN